MPAERMPVDRKAASEAIDAFLRAIGRDPQTEPALLGTGARVTDAFVDERGMYIDAAAVVRGDDGSFTFGGETVKRGDQVVIDPT